MKIKELLTFLKEKDAKGVKDIDFEDYFGNTLFKLSDLSLADLENDTLRLQDDEERKFQVINKGYFPITSLSREDIIQAFRDETEAGEDPAKMERISQEIDKIKDAEMQWLASKMSDAFCDCCFWTTLKDKVQMNFKNINDIMEEK